MTCSPRTAPVRGAAAGVTVGALTIAAHGLGGGEFPGSPGLTLLLAIAIALGAAAGTLPLGNPQLFVLLGAGQLAGHYILGGLAHEHGDGLLGGWSMAGAHLLASAVCALLIGNAQRCWDYLAGALRAVVSPYHRPRNPRISRPISVPATVVFPAIWLVGAISRRGPPLAAATV